MTQWVRSILANWSINVAHMFYSHLECIALKQTLTKWICKVCEASGLLQAKCLQKGCHHITILGNVPDYIVSPAKAVLAKKINALYFYLPLEISVKKLFLFKP